MATFSIANKRVFGKHLVLNPLGMLVLLQAKTVAILGLGDDADLSKPLTLTKIAASVASLAADAKAATVGLAIVGVSTEVAPNERRSHLELQSGHTF